MRYLFEEFELDLDAFELRRAGEPVGVEPQVFDVLALLVRNRDRVVSKEEILDEVWGNRFVSESALTSRLKAARRALGDDGRAQRCIRTTHGRGYRFVLPVQEVGEPPIGTEEPAGHPPAAAPRAAAAPDEAAAIARDAASPIRYTRSDGLNIAYQVTGSGSTDLVLVAGFVSHLMLDWTERRHAHFLHRLGSFSRLIRFDKRGTGMSDRPEGMPDLETRMGDVSAVMAAASADRVVLFGYSEGGPMSVLYAATHPERVMGMVIYSSYARRLRAPGYPWGRTPEERQRYAEELEHDWAFEADLRHMCPNADEELARWWGERCRAATSPGAARALIEMNSLVDITDVLGAVRAPTLVLHRTDDIDSVVEEGRFLAEHIPGARFIELPGADHFVAVDPDQILDPVEEFVQSLAPTAPTEWSLVTVLAVHLEERLDPAWIRTMVRDLLLPHRGVAAEHAAGAGHEETTGDGCVLATFDGPGRAVRCALELVERAAGANLHLGVGLHIAEVARHGATVEGPGVTTTAAVAERTTPGEVWITQTLRDLLFGAGFEFEHRAEIDPDGEPGRMLELVRVLARS